MNEQSETVAALGRAARRAAYHLLRAGIEGLKALEAFVDELARVGKPGQDGATTEHIPVE